VQWQALISTSGKDGQLDKARAFVAAPDSTQ
jgi:hypothetical protein